MMTDDCNVLLVYPSFPVNSFWNMSDLCEIMGARYLSPPLGLITVAAMLPPAWTCRLVDRNADTLTDADLDWADVVMTGGMMFQYQDTCRVMAMARAHGKPCVIGGPAVTSEPHVYADADFRVIGEAESVIDAFVADWRAGKRSGTYEAPKYKADVAKSPMPRFELLKFDRYVQLSVQFSRGCPFTCEFCDIIELYGRVPRTKTTRQVLAELDRLYALGYRGSIDFVDDNLIGNKKAVKAFLPELIAWQEAHDFPFEFQTEASLNLSDDHELLRLMRDAGFYLVFVGIESPDSDTLVGMQKKQNTRRSIAESLARIYNAGIFVNAGFIVGFDSEKGSVADGIVQLVEEAPIPGAIINPLVALPNTQLGRRMAKEGRLIDWATLPWFVDASGFNMSCTFNFVTARERRDVLKDFRDVLERLYAPEAYFGRVRRLATQLWPVGRPKHVHRRMIRRDLKKALRLLAHITFRRPDMRREFWATVRFVMKTRPAALATMMRCAALYAHFGPHARFIVKHLDDQIADIDAGRFMPRLLEAVPEKVAA